MYITEIDMKKQYKSSITKSHKINKCNIAQIETKKEQKQHVKKESKKRNEKNYKRQ